MRSVYRRTVLACDALREKEPDAQRPARRFPRLNWRFFARLATVVLALFLTNALDPFGLSSGTDQLSREVYHRVTADRTGAGASSQAPSIPPGSAVASVGTGGRAERGPTPDDILVLLWSEGDLENLGTEWPASYGWHADILGLLLAYAPQAVFVDISFIDDRRALDPTHLDLLETIRAYDAAGVPLLLADPHPERDSFVSSYYRALWPDGCQSLSREEMEVTDGCGPAGIPVSVPGGDFDRFGIDYPFVHPHYYLGGDAQAGLRPSERRPLPTAACRLYAELRARSEGHSGAWAHDWCHRQAQRFLSPGKRQEQRAAFAGPPPVVPTPSAFGWSANDSMPPLVEVEWSVRDANPALEGQNAHLRCAAIATETPLDILLEQFSEPWRQTCGPQVSFNVGHLVRASADELERFVRGKVIFYAADLTAISDRIEPPTHTPLPGVYFHAMAFETLLRHAGQPALMTMPFLPPLGPDWLSGILDTVGDALLLVALVPLVALGMVADRVGRGNLERVEQSHCAGRLRVWRYYLHRQTVVATLYVLAVCWGVGLCVFAAEVLKVGAINYVGLATLGGVHFILNLAMVIPPVVGLGPWCAAAGRSFDQEVAACRREEAQARERPVRAEPVEIVGYPTVAPGAADSGGPNTPAPQKEPAA